MKIAVVGAGISGLVAAYHLSREHDVTVFERNAYAGGHSNTVTVQTASGPLGLDTGFIVYNERTYPLFSDLLSQLGVDTQPSEMSFSVSCRRCRLEYSSRYPRGLFAQPYRLVDPRFLRMLAEIGRFNRWGAAVRNDPRLARTTLEEALAEQKFSRAFVDHYILPMTGAIWSASAASASRFPLSYFLQFFHNHGLLQVSGQPQWRTVTGGSQRYVERLTRRLAHQLHLSTPVRSIRRDAAGVEITTDHGSLPCDKLVLATHTDEAIQLLSDADAAERAALGAVPYVENEAVLHTDRKLLPRRRVSWSSWNYHVDDCRAGDQPLRMTYYLNRLQALRVGTDYCVTLNQTDAIDPEHTLARITYHHPVYTREGLAARQRLRTLSGRKHTYFAGAYLGYGFHEDGIRSALDAVDALQRSVVSVS